MTNTPSSQTHNGLIESAMQNELLQSHLRRVTVLIGLLAFLMVLIAAVRLVPEAVSHDIRAGILSALLPFSLILIGNLAYELLVRAWLKRLLASGRSLPRGFEYFNAFLEMGLPTAAILIGGLIVDPLSILAGALPYLYFLFILLAALSLDFWLCAFAGGAACVQFLAVSFFLLERNTVPVDSGVKALALLTSPHQYLMKGALLLASGLIAGFVAAQIRRQLAKVVETLEERDRAVSVFGQHVSPQVADLLLKQPIDFTGQERNVCVMFLDIRDFSKYSSEHTATEVVDYLNILFGPMIPIINGHSGIVNKFLGDGFMAVFGSPLDDREKCRHATEAAMEILRQVEQLNREGKIPPTRVGMGLHVGEAVTGNVGGEQRKEYTVIGDVVNLAARIEQANKPLAAQLLISEAVHDSIRAGGEFPAEDMGLVELKGQPQPVRLYRLA